MLARCLPELLLYFVVYNNAFYYPVKGLSRCLIEKASSARKKKLLASQGDSAKTKSNLGPLTIKEGDSCLSDMTGFFSDQLAPATWRHY
jgi:hypothetical protein